MSGGEPGPKFEARNFSRDKDVKPLPFSRRGSLFQLISPLLHSGFVAPFIATALDNLAQRERTRFLPAARLGSRLRLGMEPLEAVAKSRTDLPASLGAKLRSPVDLLHLPN
jgi:hypothetical protein